MIVVSDSDILSMFGKAGAVSHLKRLFGEINIPPAVYEELRRAKEIGFDFVGHFIQIGKGGWIERIKKGKYLIIPLGAESRRQYRR